MQPLTALILLCLALNPPEPLVFKHHAGWVGGVAFSDDSRYLASAGADRTVQVLDLTKKKPDRVLRGHKDHVGAVAFAPKASIIASASYDLTARLANLDSEAVVVLKGHKGVVTSIAFSPDGKWVATGSIDATAIIWDVATGKPAQTLDRHTSWVNAVAFNCVGELATGGSDNTVRVWRLQDKGWTEKARFDFPEGEVRALAFAPSGKTLAAGMRYGALKIIDVPARKVLTLKAHSADVWAVAFSPDGKTLASGNGDWNRPGDVRLWDAMTWKETRTFKTSGEVLCLTFSPAGNHLAAGCWDGALHLWRLDK